MAEDRVPSRLVTIWSVSSEDGASFKRNAALSASDVWRVLASEFPLPVVRGVVEGCLREVAEAQWGDERLDERQLFLADCCLALECQVPELEPDVAFVQELVYKLDSAHQADPAALPGTALTSAAQTTLAGKAVEAVHRRPK